MPRAKQGFPPSSNYVALRSSVKTFIANISGKRDNTGQFMDTEHQITISGRSRLSYHLWRTGKPRRLLVLIHGMASNHTRWSEFLEYTEMKSSWDILRVNLRGHQPIFHREKLGYDRWCEDIVAIMKHEGYEKCVLAGHSLGAKIAAHFASMFPERTNGLILIDPVFKKAISAEMRALYHLRFFVWLLIYFLLLLNRIGLRRRDIAHRDLRELDEKTRTELIGSGKLKEMVSQYSSPWPDIAHFPFVNYMQEFLLTLYPVNVQTIRNIPTLSILAASPTFGNLDTTKNILSALSNGTIVQLEAFHWPLTEKPVETREAIEKWCNEYL